jgi:8-oxo-dGTP pyrophosphatase MutT (NUDIX family)
VDAPLKDAAVIVLLRHPQDPEVYWVRRADQVSYQPGFQSFLGGKLHPEDRRVQMEGIPDGPPRWMRACAVRESLEEAGVLAALADGARPDGVRHARHALLEAGADLATLAERFGWRFDGRALEDAGRWMTPPFTPLRFDSWYFLAWLPPGQEASVLPGELAWGEWVKPAEALERWRRGEVTRSWHPSSTPCASWRRALRASRNACARFRRPRQSRCGGSR